MSGPVASPPGARARRLERFAIELPPEALIVLAILSVQVGSGLAASLLREHGALALVTLRLVFGALLLVALRRPRLRPSGRAAVIATIALGIDIAAMNSFFYLAIARIPLGVVVAIEFWGPLAVGVFGSRRARDLVWVALAAVGIWILTGGRLEADDAFGVAAALAAGAGWALFVVLGSRVARGWPDGRGLAAAVSIAALVVLPVSLVGGGLGEIVASPDLIVAGLVVAALASAIPWSLELAALRRLPNATYGVLMSLEPAVAAVLGAVVLAQALDPAEVVAIGVVVVASAGASRTARSLEVAPGELEAA